jgi:TPR repeat protein
MDMKEAAAAYEAGSQYFLNLARAVTPELMDVHAENEWSARQCIHHMADSEAQSYARLRRLVAEPEGSTIQGYIQKKPESIPSLKLYAEGGDPFAQLFLGLAYSDDWTGIQNQAESCRWIKEAGAAGVSSARYFIAQRAYAKSPCFSALPTLEQAKIWAELAAQSSDQSIKKDAQELMLEILKSQIAGNK